MLADAEAHREALHGRVRARSRGRARTRSARRSAALDRPRTVRALSERVCARLQAEIAEAAHDVRATAEAVVADPERLADVQARRALLRELMRKYGPTLADVVAYGSRVAGAARPSSSSTTHAPPRSTPARADALEGAPQGRGRRCRRCAAPPPGRWPTR